MSEEQLEAFLLAHKPEGDWPTADLFRESTSGSPRTNEETNRAVLLDNLYALRWACNMLGVKPGQETHTAFLEAVAEAAIARGKPPRSDN